MSTTPAAASPSSTAPSPSSPPNYNASTLLFGFLVSALTIFAVFMTFAIVWNRLIARRHAIEAMLATTPPELPRLIPPKMWDIWIVPDTLTPPWIDIKPVAAQKYDHPAGSPQNERTTPFWRHIWDQLPPEITYLFYRPIPPVPTASPNTDASQVELSHGSDIQISLLITMPHAPQEGALRNRRMFHETVFATTTAFYHNPTSS